jgi:hypothetical protein
MPDDSPIIVAVATVHQVLDEIMAYLRLPAADAAWSTFDQPDEAVDTLRELLGAIDRHDRAALAQLRVLFLPTGDLQEISISSGWGDRYLELASEFEKACEVLSRGWT